MEEVHSYPALYTKVGGNSWREDKDGVSGSVGGVFA